MNHEERDQCLRSFYGDELIEKIYRTAVGVDPEKITACHDGKVFVDFANIPLHMGLPSKFVSAANFAYWREHGVLVKDIPWGSLKSGWKSTKYEKDYTVFLQVLFDLKNLEVELVHLYNQRLTTTVNETLQALHRPPVVKNETISFYVPSVVKS